MQAIFFIKINQLKKELKDLNELNKEFKEKNKN
jgi:hypothetical protein